MLAVVTTSWDDGHPLDLRVADCLVRHGVAGTFYVPLHNPERPVMGESDLRALASAFEIGAHTRTHVRVTGLRRLRLRDEVSGTKTALEALIGRPVTAFCYPGGAYTLRAREEVKKAGFKVARTTRAFRSEWDVDPLLLPITLQAFPHPVHVHVRHAVKEGNFTGLWRYVARLGAGRNWVRLALRQLELAVANGGWWHLWGHSWEVAESGAWKQVDTVLAEAGRSGARSCTNSELADLIPSP